MSSFSISAKLHKKFDTEQVSQSFQKREFVVEYAENPMYPQYLKFQLIQDKCEILNAYNPGDQIVIHFNLKGREWTKPTGEVIYFNSLEAWRLENASAGASPQQNQGTDPEAQSVSLNELAGDEGDDLPF